MLVTIRVMIHSHQVIRERVRRGLLRVYCAFGENKVFPLRDFRFSKVFDYKLVVHCRFCRINLTVKTIINRI